MDKELLILLLRQSKEEPIVKLEELEESTNKNRVNSFFNKLESIGIRFQPTIDNNYQITREQRSQIAIMGAVEGVDFEQIINELSWQEFEILTTIVGDESGYEAKTGLNFSTAERKYQIDVILKNSPYVLLIDCKHYGGFGKQSVLRTAVIDQIDRVKAVADSFEELKKKLNVSSWKKVILMPMVITWLDDELFFHENVPVVPFPKLRSFLQNFYLYFEDIYQIPLNKTK
ncbi:MAG: hypothetical protein FK733_09500 [Asgard group archaeon]|nr:hypothetical protein [Asgard group archaeon]